MSDCIFCRIVKGEIPCQKVHETKDFLAFMDIRPVSLGHVLITPKHHCRDILDFPKSEETDFLEFVKKVSGAVKEAMGADGFNLGMNNGEAAGQTVFHAHIHIIPRYSGDGLEMWPAKAGVSQEDITAAHKKIVSFL